ncbi:hypothetical protein HYW53_02090 [Candidatus Giovannonibacteria bacterium]|nr:hypothetical protein [Candidatus Giovannonibacteria bacterium]
MISLYIFGILFLGSLFGLLFIFFRRFAEVGRMDQAELHIGLRSTRSLRKQLKENYLIPFFNRIKNTLQPFFWGLIERMLKNLRLLLSRFDNKLKELSDAVRGKHINIKFKKRTEYWDDLNGAKKNGNVIAKGIIENGYRSEKIDSKTENSDAISLERK